MNKFCLTTLALIVSSLAFADPIEGTYDTDNAAGDCSGAPHGLWTNNWIGDSGSCPNNYFAVEDLVLTLTGDGSGELDATSMGTLIGTVINPTGIEAFINIVFSGWSDGIASGYKAGGGAYNEDEQDFFASLSGSIWVDENMDGIQQASEVYLVTQMAGTYVQVGLGANDKNSANGLSTWLTVRDSSGSVIPHWDINLNITAVPEPGTLALLGLGLFGMAAARRRRLAA